MSLTPDELRRYSRQVILPELGIEGQARLSRAKVLVVGAGGLGTPVALYLSAAGVGEIGLIDPDTVQISNLHRQVLYQTSDVGRMKVEAASEKLQSLNAHVRVQTHAVALTAQNALELLAPWDLVLDGTDNFAARYLVNDACVLLGKRNVFASVLRFEGQVSVFGDSEGPCYRCLYPEAPPAGSVPSCAEAGVLGVLPGLMGMLQATEAVKLITGIGTPLVGRMLLVDARRMSFREMKVGRRPDCMACGIRTIKELRTENGAHCMTLIPPAPEHGTGRVTPEEFVAWRAAGHAVQLVDVREAWEVQVAPFPDATHIPLGMLSRRVSELAPGERLVIGCHHGNRSRTAVTWLAAQGFRDVWNLEGGIDRWSEMVDPSVPRY